MDTKNCESVSLNADRVALELDRIDSFFCEYLANLVIEQRLGRDVRVRAHSSDSVEFAICQKGLSQKRQQIMQSLNKHLLGSLATLRFLGLIDVKTASVMDAVLSPPVRGLPLDIEPLLAAGFLVRINKRDAWFEQADHLNDGIASFLHRLNQGVAV